MVDIRATTSEAVLHGVAAPKLASPKSHEIATGESGATDLDDAQAISAKTEALLKELSNAFPIDLLPCDVAAAFRDHSNHRLDEALQQGIQLDELYIDEETCLPAWPTLSWDSEVESLHNVIQKSLVYDEGAKDMGDLMQREIKTKSSERLRQARELGIKLEQIVIGESLLPEWTTNEDDDANKDQGSPISVPHDTPSISISPCVDGNTPEVARTPLEYLSETEVTSPSPDLTDLDVFWERSPDASPDSDESDDEQSDGDEPDDNASDCIYMDNQVSTQPIYDEHVYSNMVHDVEMVGGPGHDAVASLEIFMALDDSDFEDLPEVELAIDKEAFANAYGLEGAVVVHVTDTDMFCLDKIEEYDDDDGANEGMQRDCERESPESSEGDSHGMELDDGDGDGDGDASGEDNMDINKHDDGASDSEMYSEEE